ncbi:hypothetical protein [Actinomadura rupiterrae]|uniref:hypothetical protein n=1 Tax=Actinomadura rupiterrae TaxID=559627 RepID=UPI0020A2A5DD|nr:hypothetical protein [Actinomadura rupiterrae]MCP2335219.1 hypothetical protein [Actinomadura rupiterrae]
MASMSTLDELTARYPDWEIFSSRNGTLNVASRCAPLSDRELFRGLHMSIIRESVEGLREALAEEALVEARIRGPM